MEDAAGFPKSVVNQVLRPPEPISKIMNTSFTLRCPSVYYTPSPTLDPPATIPPLSPEQFLGQWYITYTSSPHWRDRRNVLFTYSLLNNTTTTTTTNNQLPNAAPITINALVTYQTLSSARLQSVHGTDTPSKTDRWWAWTWRGNGLLRVASSQWEILGYGELSGSGGGGGGGECEGGGGQWTVVFAQKSIWSPAGINVYTREKKGLPEAVLERIKTTLADFGQDGLRVLVESLYSVRQE